MLEKHVSWLGDFGDYLGLSTTKHSVLAFFPTYSHVRKQGKPDEKRIYPLHQLTDAVSGNAMSFATKAFRGNQRILFICWLIARRLNTTYNQRRRVGLQEMRRKTRLKRSKDFGVSCRGRGRGPSKPDCARKVSEVEKMRHVRRICHAS